MRDRGSVMKGESSQFRWIDGEEEEQNLDADNQIYSNIEPTTATSSPAEDSPAQIKIRAELKRSGLKICFQSRRDGNSELYVMDADGSNAVNITKTASVDEIYPHISRDDRCVCFTVVHIEKLSNGCTVPRFDVYWMNLNGSRRTLVATDATDPCWDPTGDLIAFVKRLGLKKTKDYHNTGLFVYNIHTHKTEELTDGELYHTYVPCWSPAGDWIVATVHKHAEFDHAIIAIDLHNKQIHSLKKSGIDGCRPDLSWDGKRICWNPNDIQIGETRFSPQSSHKLPLRAIAKAPPPQGSVYFGDWSPDGRYIAYATNPNFRISDPRTGAPWDIFVTRAKGGPYLQLTFDRANNKHPEFFLQT